MLRFLPLILATLCLTAINTNTALGEQIVIDENSVDGIAAGDFYCSPCYSPILADAGSINIASNTLTTGELYKYFKSRGIKRLERLSFQVDVDCDPDNVKSVSLTELSFQIQDAAKNLVTDAAFGDTELLLDQSEITSFKPEAVLEVDLGYDFMQRFSADSTEAVELNFASSQSAAGMMPRIVLSSNISSFSSSNLVRIGGFIAFWGVIFFGAHVISRKLAKDGNDTQGKQVTLTANASATSAASRLTSRMANR